MIILVLCVGNNFHAQMANTASISKQKRRRKKRSTTELRREAVQRRQRKSLESARRRSINTKGDVTSKKPIKPLAGYFLKEDEKAQTHSQMQSEKPEPKKVTVGTMTDPEHYSPELQTLLDRTPNEFTNPEDIDRLFVLAEEHGLSLITKEKRNQLENRRAELLEKRSVVSEPPESMPVEESVLELKPVLKPSLEPEQPSKPVVPTIFPYLKPFKKSDESKYAKSIEERIDLLLKVINNESVEVFLNDTNAQYFQELVDLIMNASSLENFFEKYANLIVKLAQFMERFTAALKAWIDRMEPKILADYDNLIQKYREVLAKCANYHNGFFEIDASIRGKITIYSEYKRRLNEFTEVALFWGTLDPGVSKVYKQLTQFYTQGQDRPEETHTNWHKFGQFFYPKNRQDDLLRNIILERSPFAVGQIRLFVETTLRRELDLVEGSTLDEMLVLFKSGTIKATLLDYLDPYLYLIDALTSSYRNLDCQKIAHDLQDASRFKQTEDVTLLTALFLNLEREKRSREAAKKKKESAIRKRSVVAVVE